MTAKILQIENLVTTFDTAEGGFNAVDGVSLYIEEGETLAVVGESGSGKSVTALSIMRLTPPSSSKIEGAIWFEGKNLLTLPDDEIRQIRGNKIAMIFQEPMTSLNPVYSIGSQIGEALITHRGLSHSQAKAETIRLLEKVRIPTAKSRIGDYPHNFSGGMRQRVMIAMALACNPKMSVVRTFGADWGVD
ncbi:Stage 0 sporulation protein KD [Aminobacter sp. MSH1]|uniref:ATP-binding cassette domain-containing protein n=1 Tax=Aminobacter sp. MSH1 TaxID=374606 RepID=UPI000D3CFE01|nr:Stage 0 sporulation protein KD [Aminobacter sp. MSH1]